MNRNGEPQSIVDESRVASVSGNGIVYGGALVLKHQRGPEVRCVAERKNR